VTDHFIIIIFMHAILEIWDGGQEYVVRSVDFTPRLFTACFTSIQFNMFLFSILFTFASESIPFYVPHVHAERKALSMFPPHIVSNYPLGQTTSAMEACRLISPICNKRCVKK
jgi:hypothetical protein